MKFLEELAARRRFGMKPGLETIRGVCLALGNPQDGVRAIHVAGTDGKGAVCAILDACLRATGATVGRYTSPHLVRINERFFLDGKPMADATLESAAERVATAVRENPSLAELTFFEALTAIAFQVYSAVHPAWTVLETGLGGRLDATNVCRPALSVITRIGLDHCDWLGDTLEKIAAEKAGIIKPGVPVVLGANDRSVRAVVEARAREIGSPFVYAPDLVREEDVPSALSLLGTFNRENAATALAALTALLGPAGMERAKDGLANVVWPGRYQHVGAFIVDGAHNPPAARALAASLAAEDARNLNLIAGFCGDKDVPTVLQILAPFVVRAYAVRTNNPRSLTAEETARLMCRAGIVSESMPSLALALVAARRSGRRTLICGSLFLAGEALVELNAYPWGEVRFDPAEALRRSFGIDRPRQR